MTKPVQCSVVVAVKNEEKLIGEALDSILRQSGVDLQLVVVDDTSDDLTYQIVQSMAHSDPRIVLLKNPRRGKCSAFNYGVASARGPYICIFAGDDIMPQGSLLARVSSVTPYGHAPAAVGLSKVRILSTNPRINGVVSPKAAGVGNPSGQSTMMNAAAAKLIFPVPEKLPNEDTWMGLVTGHLPEIRVVHSDTIACDWRVHEGNTSATYDSPFDEFTIKIARRMDALDLFLETFKDQLDSEGKRAIQAKIHCESMRREGKVVGVMRSDVPVGERLRALAGTNRFFFQLAKAFYTSLSGR